MKKRTIGSIAIITVVLLFLMAGIFVALKKRSNVAETGNVLGVSWYQENGTEFTITTAEELYEFAQLSDYYNFAKQTIKLGADIVVNEGNAEEWGENAPAKRWKPIKNFAGTFDGQGHTISGLYMKGYDVSLAVFTGTKMSATVQDFKLTNTYLNTMGSSGVASISSGGGGTFKRIYSDAIINHDGGHVGGLFSSLSMKTVVEECCYDGAIETTERIGGGIVDEICGANVTMSHVLFSGSITSTYADGGSKIGGLVGTMEDAGSVLKLDDSLITGKIQVGNMYYTGTAIGVYMAGTAIESTDSYSSDASYDVVVGRSGAQGTSRGVPADIRLKDITGDQAYVWTTLDFDKYWTTVVDDTPNLQCFASEIRSTAGLEKAFDISWYDESKSEFVFTDMKELYGFRVISMGNDFKGKTVKLGADIVVNTGDAKNFAKEEPAFMWSPIGKFAGTFDGQGHSISGLYINTASDFKGLFAETTLDATVKNLKLVNSYYCYTGGATATMGGIAGRGNGVFENIYTDVIIDTNGQQTGGLVGAINADHENRISNCWFDGEIRVKDGGRYVGGIVSNVVKGDNLIEHCLSTGTIINETVNTGIHLGGLVGVTMNSFCKLTMNDCLHAGTIQTAYDVCVGSVFGRITGSSKITIQNTYATEESYTHKTDGFRAIGNNSIAPVSGSVIAFPESMLSGVSAYQWTMLDFDNFWAAQTGDTPILKQFATKSLSVAGVKKNFDTSWYKADATSYVLDSREDLYGFYFMSGSTNFKDKTVKLGANITVNTGNAADFAINAPTYAWYPIPSFAGTFDGQGYTISGIYVNTNSSYAGLFGKTVPGSTIKNVKVTNSYFNSTASMAALGSIAGQMGGTLDTVYSNAILTTTGTQIGGLVGRINNTGKDTFTVNNCWFDGSVDVKSDDCKAVWAGGIVGTQVQGTLNMSNVLNTGKITYVYENFKYENGKKAFPAVWVGGIFGGIMNGKVLNDDGSLRRVGICNLTGALNAGDVVVTVKGETHQNGLGVIFGYMAYAAKGATVNYKDVFYVKDSCIKAHQYNTTTTVVTGSAIAWDENMLSGLNGYKYTTLDFDKYWAMVVNPDSTPILASFAESKPSVAGVQRLMDISWYDPNATEYTIDSLADLYGFYAIAAGNNFKGKTVKLGADITINAGDADTFETTAPANEWYPIASLDKPFAGTFDGQGHTIYGMYIDSTSRYLGLFASTTKDAVIKNLRLKEAYVNSTEDGYPQTASVVGLGSGTFDNIYSDAIVSAEGNYVGGILGRTTGNTKMTRCWYDGILTVKGKYSGGILGVNEGGSVTIENCLNTGTIINTYTKDNFPHAGGVVGAVTGEGANGVIRNCVNTGLIDIQGIDANSGSAVGAIIGRYGGSTTGTVENAYYTSESFMLGISTNTAGVDNDDEKVIKDDRFVKIPECYLNGVGAYRYTDLNFATTWSAIDGDAPALKCIKSGMDLTEVVKTDTSWYNENNSEYEIDTVGKLYGLTKLALKNNFAGKTITLTANMPVNADWMPIGAVTEFQGVFNGNMHTITGIQVKANVQNVGFIGWSGMQSRIENVKLLDSKIESSYEGRGYTGSIAGCFSGNMNTVYSNAEVIAAGDEVAGIIGRLTGNGTHQISNVWFDGSVTSEGKQDISCIGGVIGRVFLGQSVMKNCLNTGSVTHNVATANGASWTGGLVGGVHCDMGSSYTVTLAMNNCLNTGKVTAKEVGAVGTVIGRARRPVSFINVYTSNDVTCIDGTPASQSTVTGVGNFSTNAGNYLVGTPVIKSVAQLSGAQARYNTTFDFYLGTESNGTWVARNGQETKDKMPGLKAFVSESAWYVADEVMVSDKAWYTNNTSATTFEISTAAELLAVGELTALEDSAGGTGFNGKTIKLTHDIVFNNGNKEDWDTTAPVNEWIPIGNEPLHNFLGSFDGQGHTISGIYLNATERYSGFFGPVNCPGNQTREIKDFRLVNSYMTYSGSTDALHIWFGGVIASVGANAGGQVTVSDIYTDVEIYAPQFNDIGGIVARISGNNTKIERCQFDGKMTFNQYGGGIFSRIDAAGITVRMTDCLSTGTIYAELNNAGGICGGTALANEKSNHLYITDCVSDCEMSVATKYVSGSLIGRLRNSDTVYVDDVYTSEKITARSGDAMNFKPGYCGICVNGSEGTATGDATVVIDANTTYELNQDLWRINNDNIPELIQFLEGYSEVDTSWYDNNPTAAEYTLRTRAEFLGLAELSKEYNFEGKTIKLGADIALNSYGNAADWDTDAPAREWPQIGSSSMPFKGVFDGDNYTISGIYVNAENQYAGLFAAVEGANCQIKNFKLVNSYFTSSYIGTDVYLGSVAGRGNAKFTNIYSSAYVHANTASTTSGQIVGGLVGAVTGGTYSSFEKCQYAGNLRLYQYGGGLLGYIKTSGTKVTMTNCLSTATIYTEMHNIGGLCGNVNTGTTLEISNCVSDLTSMSVPNQFCSGSVISRLNNGTGVVNNVYTTNNITRRDNNGLPNQSFVGIGTSGGTQTGTGITVITSTTTYNLDTSIWQIGTDNVPELKDFVGLN